MSKGLRYGDAVKLTSMLEEASHGSVVLMLRTGTFFFSCNPFDFLTLRFFFKAPNKNMKGL